MYRDWDFSSTSNLPLNAYKPHTMIDPNRYIALQRSILHSHAVPSAPPENFTVTATVPTKLTLTWNHPPEIEINGELRGYSLRYTYEGMLSPQNVPIPAGDMPTFVLDNLENFTLYELAISATTINGTSRSSASVTQMTTENG